MSDGQLRIGFTGDVSFTGFFERLSSPEKSFAGEIADFFHFNHHNVANIEGPITERVRREGIGPTLASPPAVAADTLRFLQIRVWNVANNHALDCGPGGLEDTLLTARGEGAQWLGGGASLEQAAAPLVLEGEGVRVGMLAVCDFSGPAAGPGVPGVFPERCEALVRERLAELRRSCDWVVVNYHGGEEFTFVPMPRRRRRLLRYLDMGADVVVAHHSHTVQGWERVGEKVVFYGLGNFIFDHPLMVSRAGTYESVVLRLSFSRDEIGWEPLFVRADREAERLVVTNALPSFLSISATGLRAAWCRDAFRVVTQPRAALNNGAGTVPAQRRLTRRFILSRLRSALHVMLRAPTYRRVVFAAMEHRLRRAIQSAAPTR